MIITDYYKFIHYTGVSKYRFDCVASTGSYEQFESLRKKPNELFMYVTNGKHTKAGQKGKVDWAISKTKHISSIFRPDVTNNLGWGDVAGTTDALLFKLTDFNPTDKGFNEGATIEIFIARGYRRDKQGLYFMFADGELNVDVEAIIDSVDKAKTTLY